MRWIFKILWKTIKNVVVLLYFFYLMTWQLTLIDSVLILSKQQNDLYELQALQYDHTIYNISILKEYLEYQIESLRSDVETKTEDLLKNDEDQAKINKAIVDALIVKTKKLDYSYMAERTVVLKRMVDDNRYWVGTGVVVKITDEATYILTNKHVIDGCDTTKCVTYDYLGEKPIQIVKISPFNYDMALVKAPGSLLGKKAVNVVKGPIIQERVYMVGHNLGRRYLYAEGYVAGYDTELQKALVIGIPVGPGNSGSGIFNYKGELVGLVWGARIIPHFPYETFDTASALCVDGRMIRVFLEGILK